MLLKENLKVPGVRKCGQKKLKLFILFDWHSYIYRVQVKTI